MTLLITIAIAAGIIVTGLCLLVRALDDPVVERLREMVERNQREE